jgi:hypothetical protein
MPQDQQMMIFMLLVVMALMMSRDTHKLFAETTRTWSQFGSSNFKAISALTAAVIVATIGRGVYKNGLGLNQQQEARDQQQEARIKAKQVSFAEDPKAALEAAAQKRPADKWDIMQESPLWNRLPEDLQEKIQDEVVLRPLKEKIAASKIQSRARLMEHHRGPERRYIEIGGTAAGFVDPRGNHVSGIPSIWQQRGFTDPFTFKQNNAWNHYIGREKSRRVDNGGKW